MKHSGRMFSTTLALAVAAAMTPTQSASAHSDDTTTGASRSAAGGMGESEPHRRMDPPSSSTALVRSDAPPPGWSPGVAPEGVEVPQGDLRSSNPSKSEGAAWGCNPITYSDNPHKSKNGRDVSGHGWWAKGNCDNNKAWVTTRLYEWYNKSGGGGAFFFKKEERKKVGAQKTSGYARVNARVNCASTAKTTWMTAVDVDVVSEVDNSERSSKKSSVWCRVA